MKLLFLANYPKGLGPSQRFRFEAYMPFLEKNGVEITYSTIMSESEYRNYYFSTVVKAKVFIKQFFIRLKDILNKNKYDVIFIQRELSFLPSDIFARILAKSGAKIIYDFDDAIWLPPAGSSTSILSRHNKIPKLIGLADVVIAGNNFLADYAKQHNNNVVIVPSVVDTDEYKPIPKQNDKVIIGWSGSPSTLKANFIPFVPVLEKLKHKYGDKIEIKVMGGNFYENKELGIKSVPFSRAEEIPFVNSFDIGLMPLPDTPWMKGKCGLKAIIYMALQIPAVVSPVGVNSEIVREGIDGFHATTENEWMEKLSYLIENPEERKKMGDNARQRVIKHYSVNAWKDELLRVIKD